MKFSAFSDQYRLPFHAIIDGVKHSAANEKKKKGPENYDESGNSVTYAKIKKAARTGPPHSDNSYLRLPTILMIYRNRFTKSRYN